MLLVHASDNYSLFMKSPEFFMSEMKRKTSLSREFFKEFSCLLPVPTKEELESAIKLGFEELERRTKSKLPQMLIYYAERELFGLLVEYQQQNWVADEADEDRNTHYYEKLKIHSNDFRVEYPEPDEKGVFHKVKVVMG